MMKQMSSPGGNVGGVVGGVGSVGGVGGGVFPPQISPQQLAMLSNIYPHMQQFHLVGDLIYTDIRHCGLFLFIYFLPKFLQKSYSAIVKGKNPVYGNCR